MKKKVMNVILTVIGIVLIVFAVFGWRYTLINVFNNIFSPKATENLELTDEQKLEDFNFLFDTICNSMPEINEYEEVYGFSFKDRKEIYKQMMLNSKSSAEYYAAVDAIIQEVPSFHTDLIGTGNTASLNCYNSEKISADRNIISYRKYWNNQFENYNYDVSDINTYSFIYADGDYYYDPEFTTGNDFKKYDKIISVNGISADEYAVLSPQIFNLHYDGQYEKAFRTRFIFNDSKIGEKCEIEICHKDNTTDKTVLYMDNCFNEAFLYNYTPSKNNETTDFEAVNDDERQISYVMISSMRETDGDKIYSELKALKYDNVILDLRSNYGGIPGFASEYIYPYLFEESFSVSNCWYMPCTEQNNSILENIYNRVTLNPRKVTDAPYKSEYDFNEITVKYTYKGKADKNKNVIILTSEQTGSSADRFVSDLKGHNLVTVVGNNTGGEGLMGSFNCVSLPFSKLVFIYMPGGAKNYDTTDNSVYGNKPDKYISRSIESKYNEFESDSYSYDDKINNDDVLTYSLELF